MDGNETSASKKQYRGRDSPIKVGQSGKVLGEPNYCMSRLFTRTNSAEVASEHLSVAKLVEVALLKGQPV